MNDAVLVRDLELALDARQAIWWPDYTRPGVFELLRSCRCRRVARTAYFGLAEADSFGFSLERSSLWLFARTTMVRLTLEQRRVLGEKVLDLANLGAAALVFSQFVGQQAVSFGVLVGGATMWMVGALIAVRLIGEKR